MGALLEGSVLFLNGIRGMEKPSNLEINKRIGNRSEKQLCSGNRVQKGEKRRGCSVRGRHSITLFAVFFFFKTTNINCGSQS